MIPLPAVQLFCLLQDNPPVQSAVASASSLLLPNIWPSSHRLKWIHSVISPSRNPEQKQELSLWKGDLIKHTHTYLTRPLSSRAHFSHIGAVSCPLHHLLLKKKHSTFSVQASYFSILQYQTSFMKTVFLKWCCRSQQLSSTCTVCSCISLLFSLK